jgi:diacylglycerol O-acyltransferase / wax synthase
MGSAMERLSTLDASFLRVESATAHMHIGWVSWLRLPAGKSRLDVELLALRIASRLHLAPRFRQRLQMMPVGEPAWVDDAEFRLERHIGQADVGVQSLAQARSLADSFLSEPLDRSLPLWSLLVIPTVGRSRAAVIGKVHHAMVDGIAAVELGTLLFDLVPDAAPADPVDWDPQPVATGVRLATQALADSAVEQFRASGRAVRLGLQPARSARLAETTRRAAFAAMGDAVRAAPPSYLNAPITPRRTLVTETIPMRRLRAIREGAGATLNDVVLATATASLRRFSKSLGAPPAPLRAMVPVSVRGDEEDGGNRITFAFIDLPCDEEDPLARLESVRSQMRELKVSGRIGGSAALLRSTGLLPGFLKERAARLAASPRMYNLTISNVPGPKVPLYVAGTRVESIYPVIPLSDRHALAIGVLSYRDGMQFAAHANPDALPAIGELGPELRTAVGELERATRTGRARHRPHHARRREPRRARS